ncbi:MAG: hypothetical protein K8T91_02345, partial [Planctomycetes bacterium]|nr:hypothetical protein [Planctomycetota bacterium]
MHTVLESLEIDELKGVRSEGNGEVVEMWAELLEVDVAGENGGLTPPARLASGRCEPPAEAGRWLGADSQGQA